MNKIKMSETDFIELTTNLADEEICIRYNEVARCKNGCANCWAKMLSKYIEF